MQRDRANAVEVVHRWASLWSSGQLSDAERIFAPELHDHRPSPARDITSVDAEKQHITWVRSAFPDLQVENEGMVIEANHVAARMTHRATHRGPFMGIPPTGTTVVYEGTVIFRLRDGRIAERWGTVDLFAILWQLGNRPPGPMGSGEVANLAS